MEVKNLSGGLFSTHNGLCGLYDGLHGLYKVLISLCHEIMVYVVDYNFIK